MPLCRTGQRRVRRGCPLRPCPVTLLAVPADGPALLGLVEFLLIAATPPLLVWAGVRLVRWLGDRRGAPPSAGPTMQSLVADLHRLRRELCGPPCGSRVRQAALEQAYDGTLMDLCRMLAVPAGQLAAVAPVDRPFARLQAEAALEAAGVVLDPGGAARRDRR